VAANGEKKLAIDTVARQWAGLNQQMASRDREIERLRRVISDTVWELRHAGFDEEAARMERN